MIKLPHIFIINFKILFCSDDKCLNDEINLSKLLNLKSNTNIKNDFTDEVKKELIIRPDFKLFIDFLKSNFKNAEIFILYNKYSNDYTDFIDINSIIEGYENINKVILNSMDNYYEKIIDNLKIKYPSLNKHKQKVFDTQLTIFTDKSFQQEKQDNIIICPTYYYNYYYDIYDKIINKYNINPTAFDNKEILEYCSKNNINVYNKNGSLYQRDLLYHNIAILYMCK